MFTRASPVSEVANVGVASQSVRRDRTRPRDGTYDAARRTPVARAAPPAATRRPAARRRPGPHGHAAPAHWRTARCWHRMSRRALTHKGVGESIYSGFTHYPHHLIFDSVCKPGSPAHGGGWCTWQGRMGWWKGVPCSRADSGVPVSIVHALPPLAAVTSRRLRQKSSASAPGRSLVSLR